MLVEQMADEAEEFSSGEGVSEDAAWRDNPPGEQTMMVAGARLER